MILTKEVEMQICSKNLKYYEEKGYEIPRYYHEKDKEFKVKRGTYITVKIEDLPITSSASLDVLCDYCGDIFSSSNSNMNTGNSYKLLNKHSCNKKECRVSKIKESNILLLGVENVMLVEDNKQKLKDTMIEKYGVESYSSLDECKEKVRNTVYENFGDLGFASPIVQNKRKATNLIRYGYESHMQNKDILNKSLTTSSITKHKNGSVNTSTQQLWIHSQIGGVLNYPIGWYNLDIAFTDSKVYVECDFSGHSLPIVMGKMSVEDFKRKENIRYNYLKNKGWKLIKIISEKNKIPINKYKIQQSILIAHNLLKYNNWVTLDIEGNLIKTKHFNYIFDFSPIKIMNTKNVDTFNQITITTTKSYSDCK